ncbi:MAG TPA: ABC transporter substrate-binding protein [Clostridiales bacterium]|nr:ABC transporter substrate-binding protein [Clostridiales bacterium]
MKRRKGLVLLLTLTLLLTLILTGCAGGQKSSKVRLWEVTHSIFYAPQYVAIYEGYFEDEGIEIELYNGGGADKVMTALLAGQADIGFMGPEASIYVYNEGKEDHAVVFAQLTQKDGSFLVGRNPEPDFKWENLAGKTIIGGRKGGVPAMTLEYVLRSHGLVPNEDLEFLTNIQFDLMAGAFTGGTGDYVALFEPVASSLELEGSGYVVASVGAAAGNVPYTAYAAKKSFIEKNEDLILRFTRAIYKGQQFVKDNTPEKIAEVIKPAFPDSDLELLTKVVKRYKDQDTWPDNPVMTKESFERLQDIIETAGELDKRAVYEDVINNTFANKVINGK